MKNNLLKKKSHMTFLDPKTNRTFEAQRIREGNGYGWLVPPWVESKPETWTPVLNTVKKEGD